MIQLVVWLPGGSQIHEIAIPEGGNVNMLKVYMSEELGMAYDSFQVRMDMEEGEAP